MDISISGSGKVAGGQYNKVRISGSGKVCGKILCESFHCSGSGNADSDIECTNDIRVSGSFGASKSISCDELHISGSARIGESCVCHSVAKIAGSASVGGNLKGKEIVISGGFKVGGDIEAELFKSSGSIRCDGLLNAEKVDIKTDGCGVNINQIGGTTILIYTDKKAKGLNLARLPIFAKLISGSTTGNKINLIEGETIAIEHCEVEKIVGDTVAIGEGCKVHRVEYSTDVEIHDSAVVDECVKI